MKASKTKIKVSKNMSWQTAGEILLEDYLKKAKGTKACLVVLNSFGDLLLKAGQVEKFDWTSIGSLFSAVKGATEGLNQLLSAKASFLQFGEPKKGFWIELAAGNSLLIGVGIPYDAKHLSAISKHLKSNAPTSGNRRTGIEALDGLSDAAVDAALGKGMR